MSTSINNLPNELFPYIFNQLNLVNLTRCRSVCTKWMKLIDELIKINELILIPQKKDPNELDWFYTDKPIDVKRVIAKNFSNFDSIIIFVQRLANIKILNDLRRLKISIEYINRINSMSVNVFNFINEFKKLEQLDCHFILTLGLDQHNQNWIKISHKNLKILCLPSLLDISFEIDCPNLQAFKGIGYIENNFNLMYHSNVIIINEPKSIKCLQLDYSTITGFDLRKCENLEILKIASIYDLKIEKLEQLFNLKQLIVLWYDDASEDERLRLDAILQRKQILKLDQLQIFVRDIELKDIRQLNEIKNQN